jgi:hypothetical protein
VDKPKCNAEQITRFEEPEYKVEGKHVSRQPLSYDTYTKVHRCGIPCRIQMLVTGSELTVASPSAR